METSALSHSLSIRITVILEVRSPSLMFGLFTLRLQTASWWLRVMF